jgi:phage terminase small subunit
MSLKKKTLTKRPKKSSKPTSRSKAQVRKAKSTSAGDAFLYLTPKQQQFILEYLANGFNGTQAARTVGYAARNADTQASRMLANPRIWAVVVERRQKLLDRREITAERVLDEIAKMAFLDPRKMFRPDGSLVPIHELGEGEAASIAGLEITELYEEKVPIGRLKKIKIADKGMNLERLGRYLKLFTDKVEHSGSLGVQLITTVPRPQRKALPKEK